MGSVEEQSGGGVDGGDGGVKALLIFELARCSQTAVTELVSDWEKVPHLASDLECVGVLSSVKEQCGLWGGWG